MDSSARIAVIGLGCWYPGARTPLEFWESILTKRRQMRRMLDVRLPLADYHSPDRSAPDKTYGDKAAYIDGFVFDWIHNRIPKSTYESTDIVHWLAYEVAKMALADSGVSLETMNRERTGVVLGNTLTGEQVRSNGLGLRWPYVRRAIRTTAQSLGLTDETWQQFEATMERCFKSAFPKVTEDTLAGGLSNTIAGRICNYFDLKGGGFTVDGACASSLIAIDVAATKLERGELDCVFAGGVDISLDTFELIGFAKATALATHEMRVFDKKAEGFIPGEGCGFVVLKRWEDARRDKDFIYASLDGWGMSTDGRGAITAPTASGQTLSILRAYEKAPYGPADLDFVECHGTGTPVGDPIELEAITQAILTHSRTASGRRCGVTSLKSLVGHTKAAAGIGGFIKSVIAVNRRVLPPLAYMKEPTAAFETKAALLYPIVEGKVFPAETVLKAGVSAMGFGGINLHVTVRSADPPSPKLQPAVDERRLLASAQDTELIPLGAPDLDGLRGLVADARAALLTLSLAEIQDYARHQASLVASHPFRAAVLVSDPQQGAEALGELEQWIIAGGLPQGEVKSNPDRTVFYAQGLTAPRVGFLFPGQGSQKLNMGRSLVERHQWARDLLAVAERQLHSPDLGSRLYRDVMKAENREEVARWEAELADTRSAQPAVVFDSLLWLKRLDDLGVRPAAAGGHSLGEITAFHSSGLLPSTQLWSFIKTRAEAMAVGREGGMLSLVCAAPVAQQLVDLASGFAVIANRNSPEQTIVSGDLDALDQIAALAAERNVLHRRLAVSRAFHSPHMEEAAVLIRRSLPVGAVPGPSFPLFSSIDGQSVGGQVDLSRHFSDQVVRSVEFVPLVENLTEQCDLLLEVGPGRVLTNLVRAITGRSDLCFPVESTAQNDKDLNVALAQIFVRGGTINFEALSADRHHRPYVPFAEKSFIGNPCENPLSTELETEAVANGPVLGDQNAEQIEQLLIRLISQWTGFPSERVQAGSHLLNDLNLESIRAGELISVVAQQCGVAGKVDPAPLVQATVGQVAEAIVAAIALHGGEGGVGHAPLKRVLATLNVRQERPNWVRTFVVEDVPSLVDKTEALSPLATQGPWALVGGAFWPGLSDALASAAPAFSGAAVGPETLHLVFAVPDQSPRPTVEFLAGSVRTLHGLPQLKSVVYVQKPGSGARAFAASLHHERADLAVLCLDVLPGMEPAEVTEALLRESRGGSYSAVSVGPHGARRVPRPSLLKPFQGTAPRQRLGPDDIVLVTGGSKGITAECAFAMARLTRCRVALLGRSQLPAEGSDEVVERLAAYAAAGLQARYESCDVADFRRLGEVIARIEAEWGPVTGVVHGAGANKPRRAETVIADEAFSEIAPKVMGMTHLLEHLQHRPLKILAALSSIIGVTGMPGNAWYAFSNEWLDHVVGDYRRTHDTHAFTLAYSVWEEIGMGARMGSVDVLSDLGIASIPAAAGVAKFLEALESDFGRSRLIVTSRLGGLDTWVLPTPVGSRLRFLDEVLVYQPGVEAAVRTRLTLERDRSVRDHCYKQTYLFPTVFGLEAMAQVLTLTLGHGFDGVRIEDVRLTRPIVVSPESGEEILIHVEVTEAGGPNEPFRAHAAVFAATTGFTQPHFSAVFTGEVRDLAAGLPAEPSLGYLDPVHDLYGRFLFQGPGFQRIRGITDLNDSFYSLSSERRIQIEEDDQSYVLGDPYFRDTLLQSGQMAFPRKKCLPTSIGSIDVNPGSAGLCQIRGKLTESTDEKIICEVSAFNSTGEPFEVMQGVEFAVLEIDETEPLSSDIAKPDPRDQALLDTALVRFADSGFAFPAVAVANLPELSKTESRSLRLTYEKPVLDRAVESFLAAKSRRRPPTTYRRLESGRIAVSGTSAQLSLAHDRRYCLVAAGTELQGCDIEPLQPRTLGQWKNLLGPSLDLAFEQILKLETADRSGTRVWTAMEALFKATGQRDFTLLFSQKKGDLVLFSSLIEGRRVYVATFGLKFSLGAERILAVVVTKAPLPKMERENQIRSSFFDPITRSPQELITHRLQKLGYEPAMYAMVGDWKNKILKVRWPLLFKEAANLNKSVYFSHYFEWMGKVREIAMQPIFRRFSHQMASGQWGMVTNSAHLEVLGETEMDDVIETDFWISVVPEQPDGALDFHFDWKRIRPGFQLERIARGHMRIAWVEILAHGQVRAEAFPDYFQAFVADRVHLEGYGYTPPVLRESLIPLESGAPMLEQVQFVGGEPALLKSMVMQTTLSDGNLVGNIYFSHYPSWQGTVRDLFFYEVLPEQYRQLVSTGEWMATEVSVNHLQDAMPFEKITIDMSLVRLNTRSAVLSFNYFRTTPGGRQKLAHGQQTVHWMVRDEAGSLTTGQIPAAISGALRERAGR